MGSSIFKDYDVTKENAASGGPGKLWKIHTATNKLTLAKCSVWAIEKKSLEHMTKQEELWMLLQRDFTSLAKLRFPLILNVSRPLENLKSAIFAETEPVLWSMSAMLESKTHLDELEIKMGLIQLCEALNFVHSTAQLVHLNLCPSSVMICQPDWKLAGFAFSVSQAATDQVKAFFDPTPTTSFGSDRPRATLANPIDFTRPSLDYLAPEVVFVNQITPAADMFALGCLIYELFGLTTDSRTPKRLLNTSGSVDTYRRNIEELVPLSMEHIPHGLRRSLEALLASNPTQRPTAEELLKSDYFNDTAVKTLQYLSHMNEHDDRSKAEFLKGLKLALGALTISNKILTTKILPPLIAELRNTILVPLLLPNIFLIAEMLEQNLNGAAPSRTGTFANVIFPALLPIAHIPEPFHIIVILLQRLEFMSKRIPEEALTKHLMPMACGALDHPNGAVVVLALKEMLPLLAHFDHETIRSGLTPRVLGLIHSQKTPQVMRVQALFTMSKLIPFAARNFVEGTVLPSMLQTLTLDRAPTTLTSVAGVCDVISHKFGIEFTATRILPALVPLLLDAGLNRKQFDTLLGILNGMTSRIVEARHKAIEETESRNSVASAAASHISDAEKLQAFSATLPPVSASISNSSTYHTHSTSAQTATAGTRAGAPLQPSFSSPTLPSAPSTSSPSHTSTTPIFFATGATNEPLAPTNAAHSGAVDANSGGLVASASASSIASTKGAAAYNAVLSNQAQRRQAAQELKEKSTLVDTDYGFGGGQSATTTAGLVMGSGSASSALSWSGNSDLFSLDTSAFTLDPIFTTGGSSALGASNSGVVEQQLGTQTAAAATTAGMLFPSLPSSSTPLLLPSSGAGDDDDFFDPRAATQSKPQQSLFELSNSSSGVLRPVATNQPLLPTAIALPQAGTGGNTSNDFFF